MVHFIACMLALPLAVVIGLLVDADLEDRAKRRNNGRRRFTSSEFLFLVAVLVMLVAFVVSCIWDCLGSMDGDGSRDGSGGVEVIEVVK